MNVSSNIFTVRGGKDQNTAPLQKSGRAKIAKVDKIAQNYHHYR